MEILAGQRWVYRTRPHEVESRVVIGPSEGDTIHISVDGLILCGPQGVIPRVGHLPVARDALLESLVELDVSDVPFEGMHEGIKTWREAKGGVFTMPLAEILEGVEWGMNTPTAVLDHLVREMRRTRLDAMIDMVMRCVKKQELVFLRHPNDPRGPLYWQFEGRSLCVVAFTEPQRAHAFVTMHQLPSSVMTPPNADAAFDFLRQLRVNDGIEWASINAGHECNVPFYLDQLD